MTQRVGKVGSVSTTDEVDISMPTSRRTLKCVGLILWNNVIISTPIIIIQPNKAIVSQGGASPTFEANPVSCLICWLSRAVFLAMLWVLRRLILSLMDSVSVFLYLSAKCKVTLLTAEGSPSSRRGGGLTDFPEALVLVDATVEGDGGVGRPLQQLVRRVVVFRVLLDGLQKQRVASDPLHRHHQEEAERGGVDLGAGGGGADGHAVSLSLSRSHTHTQG